MNVARVLNSNDYQVRIVCKTETFFSAWLSFTESHALVGYLRPSTSERLGHGIRYRP